ncbi:DUF3306 domain-containing protein [Shewanella sp. YIC-542]|uniref:DUF3306 domain-containing protein n=1 Tax=Shewanella mytili TaxID=3377111 RepID=UPI00398E5A81
MAETRSFLSRWALRKQQAQGGELPAEEAEISASKTPSEAELVADADVIDEAPTAAEIASEPETDTPESLLTAEDLPDPDSIEIGGSFASFMANNVDPNVKKNALRALWKQPHFSEIDGMMEYALDYSCQPTLSAEVSSELAKKVFRHLLDNADEETTELADAESLPPATEALASATPAISDNLDEEPVADSQNATFTEEKPDDRVV